MIERVMQRDKATEHKPQLNRGQLFKASLALQHRSKLNNWPKNVKGSTDHDRPWGPLL